MGDLLAFAVPCLIFVEIRIVGRLFLAEIILTMLLPILLVGRGRALLGSLPRTFLALGLIWLFGQIITDIIRSSYFEDYARGWSKIVFVLLNFSAIYLLLSYKTKRMILFAVGIAVGQVLQFFINPNVFAVEGHVWKFGVGNAVTLLLVVATQWRCFARIPFIPELVCGAAAVLNVFLGYRSLGALCFLTALYVTRQRYLMSRKEPSRQGGSVKTLVGAIILGGCAIVFVGTVYGYAAGSGWLGEDAKQKYEWQSSGKLGFFIGGRPELLVSSLAIVDSPIIGHGSWAKDPKYSMLLLEQLSNYDYEGRSERDDDLIPTHSYLLGAWVESGLAGAVFWFWVLMFSAKTLIVMRRSRSQLSMLIVFGTFGLIWNILFSPFGAESRIYAAYYILLTMYGTVAAASPKVGRPFEEV